jgi:hypothetical protein
MVPTWTGDWPCSDSAPHRTRATQVKSPHAHRPSFLPSFSVPPRHSSPKLHCLLHSPLPSPLPNPALKQRIAVAARSVIPPAGASIPSRRAAWEVSSSTPPSPAPPRRFTLSVLFPRSLPCPPMRNLSSPCLACALFLLPRNAIRGSRRRRRFGCLRAGRPAEMWISPMPCGFDVNALRRTLSCPLVDFLLASRADLFDLVVRLQASRTVI